MDTWIPRRITWDYRGIASGDNYLVEHIFNMGAKQRGIMRSLYAEMIRASRYLPGKNVGTHGTPFWPPYM